MIWRHTSEQIPKAPLLGAGIGTGRALHEAAEGRQAPVAPGTQFALSTGLHSHNAYLQVWYEAGAVGASSCSVSVCRPAGAQAFADRCAALSRRHLHGLRAAWSASAYSIWAPWFMAALAMAAIFAVLGATLPGALRQSIGRASSAGEARTPCDRSIHERERLEGDGCNRALLPTPTCAPAPGLQVRRATPPPLPPRRQRPGAGRRMETRARATSAALAIAVRSTTAEGGVPPSTARW